MSTIENKKRKAPARSADVIIACIEERLSMGGVGDGANVARPSRSVPLWLARTVGWFMERRARRRGAAEAPRLTQARLKFLGLNLGFSIDKARTQLGYQPRVHFADGIKQTMAWYRKDA